MRVCVLPHRVSQWYTISFAAVSYTHLSDLLWADGYRICAVGGSDVHLKETERYGDSPEPARPGEPSTYLYMEGLSAAGFRDALKSCHAYVARHCSLDFSCMLYDAEHQKLEGGWLFGDQLPKECRYLEYDLYTDRKSAGERELQPCIPYVIINGKKQLLQKESAEHAQSEIRYHGVLMLPDAPYVWIRFGAEDEDGGLVFYANPFTQGGREQHQYQTFGDVLPSLSL